MSKKGEIWSEAQTEEAALHNSMDGSPSERRKGNTGRLADEIVRA